MAVDPATHIGGFDVTLPIATADAGEGDDNLRHIKNVLKTDFAGVTGAVTATHTELNILDGVTATTAELNILDGVTSTAAELNKLDGISTTATELGYVNGVTSAIQTQLNAKAPSASPTLTSATLNTAVSGTAVLDEDNMVSDSATKLATQQSIKAYVDAQVATVAGIAQIITGYVNETSFSSSTGEDVAYVDKTVTAVSDTSKCVVHLQIESSRSPDYAITGRLTSTTNLRLACRASLTYMSGRYYIVEYS